MILPSTNLRNVLAGLSLATGVVTLAACGTLRGPPRDGFVSQASGTALQLCLERGLKPAPGQELHLVRHEPTGGPRGLAGMREREVGVARVTASVDDGCVPAIVVSGRVRRYDHVRHGDVQ